MSNDDSELVGEYAPDDTDEQGNALPPRDFTEDVDVYIEPLEQHEETSPDERRDDA